MKNLPEKDFWNEVKTRLNNYSEMPDDDGWDRIAGALPKAKSPSVGKRWTGIALIFLLGTSTGYLLHQYAPLSGNNSASLAKASSIDSSTDPTTLHDAGSASGEQPSASAAQGNVESDRSVPAENSNAAVGSEALKQAPEVVGEQYATTLEVRPSRHEVKDQDSNRDVRRAKQGTKVASLDHAATPPIGQPSIPESDRGEVETVANSNLPTAEPSVALTDRSGENHAVDTNATARVPADASGDPGSSDSNQRVLSPESDRGKAGSNAVKSNQPVLAAGNSETNAIGRNVGDEKSSAPEVQLIPEDSVIAEKPKVDDVVVSGQSEKKEHKQKKEKRVFHADVYANITPSLSFQKISPSGNDDLRIIGLRSNGVMSGDRFGISLEAGFQRKLTPRLDFYVGLSYYRQKQTLTYEFNGSGVTVDQGGKNGEYSITPMKESKSFQYSMTNAGISSGMMYHLFGDKLMHKIGGGLQFQKGLLRMGSESSYNNAESFYFNYQLSYRLEVQMNKKWNVYLQPTFIHSIIANEEMSEPLTITPYRAGLGIGAIYHF